MTVLIFIFGIILFVGLVIVHEFGHAIAARRNGVEVEEFGIGFPPRAWSKRLKSGTRLSLNWLPLGGFVRLKGEHDSATGPGTYGGASMWVKTKILLAGVVANWLVAIFIFTTLALTSGLPQLVPAQFTVPGDTIVSKQEVIASQVVPHSPADKAGLREGDILLQLNGKPIASADQLVQLTASHAGQRVSVLYQRSGGERTVNVALNKNHQANEGYIGIAPGEETLRRSTWSAPIVGVGVTAQFTWLTAKGLGATVAHLAKQEYAQAGANVAGPVGIVTILQDSSKLGLSPVLFLIGIVSLTLAVMNVLPIPALDGGRLFVTLLFRATRRPLTKRREEAIQSAGFAALILLVVVIKLVGVGRLLGGR